MERKKIISVAMKLTEAIVKVLNDELIKDGKVKNRNADKQKKVKRLRRPGG